MHDDWGPIDPGFVARVVGGPGRRRAQGHPGAHARPSCRRPCRRDRGAGPADDRVRLITALGRSFDAEALAELDEAVRDELMEALPNDVIASAIKKLDTDDALYLIEDLERDDQREILSQGAEGGARRAGARASTIPSTPPAA